MKYITIVLGLLMMTVSCSKSDCDNVSIRFINDTGIDFENFEFLNTYYGSVPDGYQSTFQCEENILIQDDFLLISFKAESEGTVYQSTSCLGFCGVGLRNQDEGSYTIVLNDTFKSEFDSSVFVTYKLLDD